MPVDDDDARARPQEVDRLGLMRGEPVDAAGGHAVAEFGGQWTRQLGELRGLRGSILVHEAAGELGVGRERVEHIARVHPGEGTDRL